MVEPPFVSYCMLVEDSVAAKDYISTLPKQTSDFMNVKKPSGRALSPGRSIPTFRTLRVFRRKKGHPTSTQTPTRHEDGECTSPMSKFMRTDTNRDQSLLNTQTRRRCIIDPKPKYIRSLTSTQWPRHPRKACAWNRIDRHVRRCFFTTLYREAVAAVMQRVTSR